MYHFSPHKELFGLFLGDLTGALGLLLGAHPLIFLELAQLIRQSVGLALDLLRQCAGLGAGSFQLILALLDKLIALLTGCIQLVGGLIFQAFHLVLTGFELELQIIQLAQNGVQTLVFCGQMLLCRLNDPLRDAKLFADKESVGLARNADAELIGGAQRLQIELAAGVDDALCLEGEHLQFCIVRCGHQEHTAAAQLFDDGNSQCRTLRRVGTGAKLVQKHQRVGHGKLKDAGDLLHMTGKGGQALLDALLIADVHEEFVKDADLTALIRRDEEAALCHRAKQTGRFQSDGLTAGVGAGDDERIIFPAQRNIDRNALLCVDERMTRPDERERRIRPDSGFERLHIQCKAGFCKQDVDFQHGLIAVLELRLNGCDLTGKCYQDTLDLLGFLCAVLKDACVCLHDSLRLDEDRRTGRRDVMDDAAHLTAILAFDRNDITAITDGDDALL